MWRKALADPAWWRRFGVAVALGYFAVGLAWDRTCNTDPNSVDACAPWRLGTLDMMYRNAAHARLSTGVRPRLTPTAMRELLTNDFCLPRKTFESFLERRPAAGQPYPLSRLKPYTFGTSPKDTAQLEESAASFSVPLTVEGHNLEWKGLQMKLVAFRDFIVSKTSPGDIVMMMDANDVLFVGEPQYILDAYQQLDAPIVASVRPRASPAFCTNIGLVQHTSGLQVSETFAVCGPGGARVRAAGLGAGGGPALRGRRQRPPLPEAQAGAGPQGRLLPLPQLR